MPIAHVNVSLSVSPRRRVPWSCGRVEVVQDSEPDQLVNAALAPGVIEAIGPAPAPGLVRSIKVARRLNHEPTSPTRRSPDRSRSRPGESAHAPLKIPQGLGKRTRAAVSDRSLDEGRRRGSKPVSAV